MLEIRFFLVNIDKELRANVLNIRAMELGVGSAESNKQANRIWS